MIRRMRALDMMGWPLWLKLAAVLTLGILLPVGVVSVIAINAVDVLQQSTLQAYVQEVGRSQLIRINGALSQSRTALEALVTAPEYRRRFLDLLQTSTTSAQDARSTALILQSVMISSPNFNRLRITRPDGRVVADVTPGAILPAGVTPPQSPAFLQASNALLRGSDVSIVVHNPANPIIEMTRAIRTDDGDLAGFLFATLNVQDVLLKNLIAQDSERPVYTYLVTSGATPVILSQTDVRPAVDLSLMVPAAAESALQGEQALDRYRIGADQSVEVFGFHSPVTDPTDPQQSLFALVTELRADAVAGRSLELLGGPTLFAVGIGGLGLLVILVALLNQLITPSLTELTGAVRGMAHGQFNIPVKAAANRTDEIGALGAAFVDMRAQVRGLLDELESRVAARARDIRATQVVSRVAATQRDLQSLMDSVVNLIVEQFPAIYHAQIFLLDQDRRFAVLRASTGEPGQALLARGHRLAVGSQSVIGQVVDQRQTVVARDTSASDIHRRNEFLPDTRAELAIPLRVGEVIIGALDVQSQYRNAFTEDEIRVLETLTDQVAVALENARLYQESLRQLEEIQRASRSSTVQAWQDTIYGERHHELVVEAGRVNALDLSEFRQQALASGAPVTGTASDHGTVPLIVPVTLRGQTLGTIEWELPAAALDRNQIQLAQELANRLAVSLENARLFLESRRLAERERVVSTIAARLTPQTDVDEILRLAVREVGQALRAPHVSIRLNRPDSNGDRVSER